jgi:hypothetical protein
MKTSEIEQRKSPSPAIAYVCRRARVSEAQAHVVATLAGLCLPEDWRHLAIESAHVVAASVGRRA